MPDCPIPGLEGAILGHDANTSEAAYEGQDDERIIALLGEGDASALDLLVPRYGNRLKRFLARIVGQESVAEDLTHDTLLRVIESSASFQPRKANGSARSRLAPWLFRIARNLALDWLRSHEVRRKAAPILEEVTRDRERDLSRAPLLDRGEQQEFREKLDTALGRLKEPFKTVFVLREVEGLSYEEIATVVGTSPKTVSTRLCRARQQLRRELEHWLSGRRTRSREVGR